MSTEQPHDPDKPMKRKAKSPAPRLSRTREEYYLLAWELQGLEKDYGIYLHDENVDRENAGLPESSPCFWDSMYRAAASAAGMRASEHGIDINEALGRVIY